MKMNIKQPINKFKSLSPTAKSALVYTFAGLATRGLSIITVPIFTRIMTTAEIGTINVFNSWYTMLTVIVTLALTSGGFLVCMKDYADKRDAYTSSVLAITSIMAILMGGMYFISPEFWNHMLNLPTELVLLLLVGLLVTPARDFWLSKQRYELKYKAVAFVSFGTALIATLFSIICVIWAKKHGVEHVDSIRLYANYLIVYGTALVIYIYIFVKGKTFYNREYWKSSLILSVPLIGNSLANQVLSVSDKTMIGSMVGNAAVGIYGTIYNVSTLSTIVWNAINSSFIPYMFQNMDTENGKKNVKKYVNYILLAYALLALAMTLVAPELIRLFATEEYYEAIYLMPPIAAGIFMISLGNVYSNVLLYYKKTQYIMIASISAAVLNVLLNAWLIPIFGYQVAAYTTLIAYFVMVIIECVVVSIVEKRLGHKNTYDNRFIFLIATVLMVLSMLCNLIYGLIVFRWSIIIIGIIVGLIFRKKIMSLLVSVKGR